MSGLYYTPTYGSVVVDSSYAFFIGKTFWSISTGGGWGILPATEDFWLGGGKKGSLTLPNGITSSAYFQATAKMELVIVPIGSANITGSVFYEAGVYEDLLDEIVPFHGPGIGLALHLDRIAIPPLGFTVAWNVPVGKPYISVQLGMSFR